MNASKLVTCAMGAALLAAGLAAPARAADRELHSDKARERLAEFEYTGRSELCLTTYRIKGVDVLDDWTLLVETQGRKYYVNHLPHRCPRLGFEQRFSYTLRGLNQLCNTDIITVLHTDMRPGASCGLGQFEELRKKQGEPER